MDVHDGDTITVAPGGALDTPISIRLYGIDAPELTQKYGTASRDALRRMLPRESSVQVISMGMDRYGRSTGLIIHDGRGINAAMLREGQAWLYKRYCRAKFCPPVAEGCPQSATTEGGIVGKRGCHSSLGLESQNGKGQKWKSVFEIGRTTGRITCTRTRKRMMLRGGSTIFSYYRVTFPSIVANGLCTHAFAEKVCASNAPSGTFAYLIGCHCE